ncbi:hypothetical protein KY289_003349 [Solanum tuberosum]|nr:hypothetical protein KY289_003349 [Solanum tuberosum]
MSNKVVRKYSLCMEKGKEDSRRLGWQKIKKGKIVPNQQLPSRGSSKQSCCGTAGRMASSEPFHIKLHILYSVYFFLLMLNFETRYLGITLFGEDNILPISNWHCHRPFTHLYFDWLQSIKTLHEYLLQQSVMNTR